MNGCYQFCYRHSDGNYLWCVAGIDYYYSINGGYGEIGMNERIQELAEQCYHRYSEHNIDLEKFAELIVRECAVLVEKFTYLEEMGLDDYKEITGKEMILSTFGVE